VSGGCSGPTGLGGGCCDAARAGLLLALDEEVARRLREQAGVDPGVGCGGD
jgi:hypothetical protein